MFDITNTWLKTLTVKTDLQCGVQWSVLKVQTLSQGFSQVSLDVEDAPKLFGAFLIWSKHSIPHLLKTLRPSM